MKRIIASFASLVLFLRDHSIKRLFRWIVEFVLKLLGLRKFNEFKESILNFRNCTLKKEFQMHFNSVLYKKEFQLNLNYSLNTIVYSQEIRTQFWYLLKFVNCINMNLHIIKWTTCSVYLLSYSQWISYVPYSRICVQEMIDFLIVLFLNMN